MNTSIRLLCVLCALFLGRSGGVLLAQNQGGLTDVLRLNVYFQRSHTVVDPGFRDNGSHMQDFREALEARLREGFALVARSTPQTVVVVANSFGYLTLTDHTTLGNFLENENHSVVSLLSNVWHEVEDGGDRHYYLQMGGHHTFESVTASSAMNLTLRRNCAKVIINVTNNAFDKTGDNKVMIEDIRLCNINQKHYYVTDFSQDAGDALVALRNSAGIILWSWHIWVTDYDPDVEMTPVSGTYVYPVTGGALHRYSGTIWGAGKEYENAFIMDRNLGALSSYGEIGDTRGAYYQFGRKDPEPATAPITYNSATADVLKAVHNPTVHYSGWWQNTSQGSVENPWNDPKLINGTGHGGDNCEADKSIYDPCPPGWRVPVHGVWSDFSPSTTEWFSSPAGRYYYPGGDPANGRVWYPAAGERIHHGSAWGGVGADGYYWTATPASGSAHYFRLNASGVTQAYNMERYLGQSVRCIRLH